MESKPLETYQVRDPSHGTIMNMFFSFCSIYVANTDAQFDTLAEFVFFSRNSVKWNDTLNT